MKINIDCSEVLTPAVLEVDSDDDRSLVAVFGSRHRVTKTSYATSLPIIRPGSVSKAISFVLHVRTSFSEETKAAPKQIFEHHRRGGHAAEVLVGSYGNILIFR